MSTEGGMMTRWMTGAVSVALTLAMMTGGAPAQVETVLELEREALESLCDTVAFRPDFAETVDLNGDGVADFSVDYGSLECDGSGSMFCGSGGCTQRIYAGRADGGVDLVGEFLAYEMVFDRPEAASFLVGVHHSGCAQDGIETCYIRYGFTDGVLGEQSRSVKPPASR